MSDPRSLFSVPRGPPRRCNRIKWRALDIVGNGPKESIEYVIKIDISQFKPKVRLLSPKNNSILPTTSVELYWLLMTRELTDVTYDVYFDTANPPVEIIIAKMVNSSIIVDHLVDTETYYWTVIPKFGKYNGSCISGIWSFSIDTNISVPYVTLINPENNSIINSPKPTFLWSVRYNGTETLSNDVYLDKSMSFIDYEKCTSPYYLPKNILFLPRFL